MFAYIALEARIDGFFLQSAIASSFISMINISVVLLVIVKADTSKQGATGVGDVTISKLYVSAWCYTYQNVLQIPSRSYRGREQACCGALPRVFKHSSLCLGANRIGVMKPYDLFLCIVFGGI